MKKTIVKFSVCAIALLLAGNVFAMKVLEGEATLPGIFGGNPSGEDIYVDFIVSQTIGMSSGDLSGGAALTFLPLNPGPGVKGDATAYANSTYFYYYQLENNSTDNPLKVLSQMSLALDSGVVLTAGFISGADIDSGLFNHNIVGDHEDAGASLFDPDVTPGQSEFQLGAIDQAVWEFNPSIPVGDESSVLFITSDFPWVFNSVGVLDSGTTYNGLLPVPSFDSTIPEPFSILLLSGSLIGLVIKKRK